MRNGLPAAVSLGWNRRLVSLHGGALAILGASFGGLLGSEHIDPQVPDRLVQGPEVFLREGGGNRKAAFEVRDIGECTLEVIRGAFLEDLVGLLGQFGPVADHEKVVARGKTETDHLVEPEVVDDGSHVEVVGHDEAAEAHLLTQQARGDGGRERCRKARGVEFPEGDMTDHHAVDGVLARAKPAEDLEFVGLEIGKRPREGGELMVGVACGRGVAREVLSTGEHSRGAERGIKYPGLLDDLVGGRSVTASTKGVVGFLVEGDIEAAAFR